MDLHTQIRRYYLAHLDILPPDKQFHFTSRLASWSHDPESRALLDRHKPQMLPPDDDWLTILKHVIVRPSKAPPNALNIRQQYFDQYPDLRPVSFGLFRVRHLLSLYDIDIRDTLLQITPRDKLENISRAVHADPRAIRALSTYAINYLYLVEHTLYRFQPELINLDYFYDTADDYDFSAPEDLKLAIYLYTHCIINESNFYTQHLSTHARNGATRMLQRLDRIIRKNFELLSLDSKLEFLVCCNIASYETTLFDQIYEECKKSISTEGTFLIDRHNSNARSTKTSFAKSEHRNVLFIMSGQAYEPQIYRGT